MISLTLLLVSIKENMLNSLTVKSYNQELDTVFECPFQFELQRYRCISLTIFINFTLGLSSQIEFNFRIILLEKGLAPNRHLCVMWVMLRKISLPFQIPSWTGFNINLQHYYEWQGSFYGYLDCLDAPANAPATAMSTKAYQIKCKEHDKFQDLFLMTGTFHIILTFLAVIASRFKDAGLPDVLIQSSIVAEGSVDTMFSDSRAYKRAIRIYKILYESFSGILFDDFHTISMSFLEVTSYKSTVQVLYNSAHRVISLARSL